jgi:hypothetical protein
MHTQRTRSQAWTPKQLVQFSDALGSGYGPGLAEGSVVVGDRWTTQRHLQAATLRGQVF